jgi:hypothetical protein
LLAGSGKVENFRYEMKYSNWVFYFYTGFADSGTL